MAMYLTAFIVPDSHIEFFRAQPGSIYAYYQGEVPELSAAKTLKPSFWQRLVGITPPGLAPPPLPADWPMSQIQEIGPEMNHRSVDLHHYLLNGTNDPVKGSGSIFQTWFMQEHSAVTLGENFAFKSSQLPELAELLAKIDALTLKSRWVECCRLNGEIFEPDDEECKALAWEYRLFHAGVNDAIDQGHGLAWVGL